MSTGRSIFLALLISLATLTVGAAQSKTWQNLNGCALVENKANDGDSFHVRWNGNEIIFRIFFADCPEEDTRFPDRVVAQAEYFGITPEQAVAVGRQAADFTRKLLDRPFSIKTRWQDALGTSHLRRNYGFIVVDGHDLAELLVANGLARIHGVGVSGLSTNEVAHLRVLEAQAKAEKLGAWGMASIR